VSEKSSPPYLFGDLLALARQSWVREMARRLEGRGYAGYRRSDAGVLRMLSREPVTIGVLGVALGITRQAARKLADALERRGYARTEPDARDGRRVNVLLTEAGHEYARAIIEVVEALNRELATNVNADQLRAADVVLRATLDRDAARRADVLVTRPSGAGSADAPRRGLPR
jgi:DNA-binding MarR family transcriptional regulator